ncbi:MAG: hypothetical protein MHM6MM_001332 [Cercozoa sp. M6MM]
MSSPEERQFAPKVRKDKDKKKRKKKEKKQETIAQLQDQPKRRKSRVKKTKELRRKPRLSSSDDVEVAFQAQGGPNKRDRQRNRLSSAIPDSMDGKSVPMDIDDDGKQPRKASRRVQQSTVIYDENDSSDDEDMLPADAYASYVPIEMTSKQKPPELARKTPTSDPVEAQDLHEFLQTAAESLGDQTQSPLLWLQLPPNLPIPESSESRVADQEEQQEKQDAEPAKKLWPMPRAKMAPRDSSVHHMEGSQIGTIVLRRSGRMTLNMGKFELDLTPSVPSTAHEEVLAVDLEQAKLLRLGNVTQRAVASYNVAQLLEIEGGLDLL